jgi:hypothetical protein
MPELVFTTKHFGGAAARAEKIWADNLMLRKAYDLAYQVLRSAERELLSWRDSDYSDKKLRLLWQNAWTKHEFASLRYWFGDESERWFNSRFETIVDTIRRWSYCFRHGFYVGLDLPVFLRCSPNNNSASAYHAEPNVVTLCSSWFDLPPFEQATMLLHEMGHWSSRIPVPLWQPSLAWVGLDSDPQDRKHSVCQGGSYNSDRCYRPSDLSPSDWYVDGDPKELVVEFEDGDDQAGDDMLGNIDNYVSYMWNRWNDHNYGWFKW